MRTNFVAIAVIGMLSAAMLLAVNAPFLQMENAYATNLYIIQDESSCMSLPIPTSTSVSWTQGRCEISGQFTLLASDTFQVNPSIMLVFGSGTSYLYGTIVNAGTIHFYSTMSKNYGTIDNIGTFDNYYYTFENMGIINNDGTINNNGNFYNYQNIFNYCNGVINGLVMMNQPVVVCNLPPVADNLSVTTQKATQVSITLTATDANSDPLTFMVVTQPANGVLSGISPNLTYTPNANFSGTDSFAFIANDGKANSNIATVSIAVVENSPPVANNLSGSVTTNMDTSVSIALTATDENSDPLVFTVVTQPAFGTLFGTAPNLLYVPNAGYYGQDSFTFKVNDGKADSNIANVSITVIDNIAPVVSGGVDRSPDSNGWYNHAVTVTWTGTDVGSGISACDLPTIYSGPDGTTISLRGRCTDNAGNVGSATIRIDYDGTAPTAGGSPTTLPNSNGWYNTDVTVQFVALDSMSGIDGSATVTTTVTTEGASQSVSHTFTDKAGNAASAAVSGINIDKTAPTISGAPTTLPNTNGWYKSAVTVHFTASDAISGLNTVSPDFTFSIEGANLSVTGIATDIAGNSASVSVTGINIDRTAPTVSGAAAISLPWYNTDVTVQFIALDSMSGIDGSATVTKTITTEGASQSVNHTFTDKAGNSATSTVSGINIDKTAPIITSLPPDVLAVTKLSGVSVTYSSAGASDNLTPSPTITYSKSSGSWFPLGTTTVFVTVKDLAGNSATGTFSVKVLTPSQAIQNLIDIVRGMNLSDSTKYDLTFELQKANEALGRGDSWKANFWLDRFRENVTYLTGTDVTVTQAAVLQAGATDVQIALGFSTKQL